MIGPVVLAGSNTNYGCAAIVWDRVFVTFRGQAILDADTGPTEPTMWQKILMSVREPEVTAVAPGSLSDGVLVGKITEG